MNIAGKNINKKYFIIVLLLSFVIGITIHFPMVMNYFFRDSRFVPSLSFIGTELLITYVVALLMFILNFFILKPVDKHGKINWLDILLAIVLTVISVFTLNRLLYSAKYTLFPSPHGGGHWDGFIYINFFVSALVVGFVLIIRLTFRQQTIKLENETLKREALQSQFESLKNQLSPHFMFNSLTALKILIKEAPDKAQNYVNNLSKALRYTLQSNEKQLVTLREEMEFIESYIYLIRIRFDSNLIIKVNIDEDLNSYNLPPLTIQTLLENAIKHNEISKQKPFRIDITTTEHESLLVINEIQKKFNKEEGTGIGLSNLTKQFELLLGMDKFSIRMEDNRFVVEVPLIKP